MSRRFIATLFLAIAATALAACQTGDGQALTSADSGLGDFNKKLISVFESPT